MKLHKLKNTNVHRTGAEKKVVRVTRVSLNVKSGLKAGFSTYN
jgi:hypothetical protein